MYAAICICVCVLFVHVLGMAEFQALPPGLNQVSYKADTLDPNIFQITGKINAHCIHRCT